MKNLLMKTCEIIGILAVFVWNFVIGVGFSFANNNTDLNNQSLLDNLAKVFAIIAIILAILSVFFLVLNIVATFKPKIVLNKSSFLFLVLICVWLVCSLFVNIASIVHSINLLINIADGKYSLSITKQIFHLIVYIFFTAISIVYFALYVKKLAKNLREK